MTTKIQQENVATFSHIPKRSEGGKLATLKILVAIGIPVRRDKPA